jgi:site-specific recombinase XerD
MNEQSILASSEALIPVPASPSGLALPEFYQLAEVPPELEWFANINNPGTRRMYKNSIHGFMEFYGMTRPHQFRQVTRSHVIKWRESLKLRSLSPATIRRNLSALSALFAYLCEKNAVLLNPVDGVQRPREGSNEGKTPALGDSQARALLEAPAPDTFKGKRDRALLSVLLYHGLRRAELAALAIGDVHQRSGISYLRVHGKGGKIRYIPAHLHSLQRIAEYLDAVASARDPKAPLFTSVKDGGPLSAQAIYYLVRHYANLSHVDANACRPHALRATWATNALDHQADIAQVQDVLGHSSIATTRLYDRRKSRPEDSPVFKVRF